MGFVIYNVADPPKLVSSSRLTALAARPGRMRGP
jgi:hypothetical protein